MESVSDWRLEPQMFPLPDRAKLYVSEQLSNRWLIGDKSIFRLKLEQVGRKSLGGDDKKSMELDIKIVLKSRGFGESNLSREPSKCPVSNVTGNCAILVFLRLTAVCDHTTCISMDESGLTLDVLLMSLGTKERTA